MPIARPNIVFIMPDQLRADFLNACQERLIIAWFGYIADRNTE